MKDTDFLLNDKVNFKCGLTSKNRLAIPPLTTYNASEDNNNSESELKYYSDRTGKVGLFITGCGYVSENGRSFIGQWSAAEDFRVPHMKKLAEAIKQNGTLAIAQIQHGGKIADPRVQKDIVGPSAIASRRSPDIIPRALETKEVYKIIDDFGEATRRCIEAGFDGIEIHAANSYLIQQFISKFSNHREDEFGKDRSLFLVKIVEKCREVINKFKPKNFILGIRLTPDEGKGEGYSLQDTLDNIDKILPYDLDYIHISSRPITYAKDMDLDHEDKKQRAIYDHVNNRTIVIGVNGVYTLEDAKKVYDNGCDIVAVGRAYILNPNWYEQAVNEPDTLRDYYDYNDPEYCKLPPAQEREQLVYKIEQKK